jgi:hypothetical protein
MFFQYTACYSTDSVKQGIKAIKLGGKGDISLANLLWSSTELPSHVSSPLAKSILPLKLELYQL